MSTASAAQARFMVTAVQLALALLERGRARRVLGRIVEGLAVGAAFADREGTGRPGLASRIACRRSANVSANTNSARRCATAVETIKIPSPEASGANLRGEDVSTW